VGGALAGEQAAQRLTDASSTMKSLIVMTISAASSTANSSTHAPCQANQGNEPKTTT
jgi:hypothetical protein